MLDTVGLLLFYFLFVLTSKKKGLKEAMLILYSAVYKKLYVVQEAMQLHDYGDQPQRGG